MCLETGKSGVCRDNWKLCWEEEQRESISEGTSQHGRTSESEIIGGARDERLFTHMITKATGHGISEKVAHRKQ